MSKAGLAQQAAAAGALMICLQGEIPTSRADAQPAPFTVDVMMKTEGIAEVMFDPRGRELLIEKTSAYDTSRSFSWMFTWNRERSALLSANLRERRALRAISPSEREHAWLASYSPSGTHAAIGWYDGDVPKAGVYDFAAGNLRKFDFPVSHLFCGFDCPYWLSEEEFIHYTVPAGEQRREIGDQYAEETINAWAHRSWQGKQPAVTVWRGDGYRKSQDEVNGTLVRVNAHTGQAVPFASGVIWLAALSPDRRRLAVVRKIGELDMAGVEIPPIQDADERLELTIHDFAHDGGRIVPCQSCNVALRSLRWSPGGKRLFFATRVIADHKLAYEHYIYDWLRRRLEKFAPAGLGFDTIADIQQASFITPFVWLTDEVPAVRVTHKAGSANDKDRHDWYALPPGRAPVPLTLGMHPATDRSPLETFVAIHRGTMLMMADGELWRISADGKRRNLTQKVIEPLSAWCSVVGYFREGGYRPVCNGLSGLTRPIEPDALEAGWVTLSILDGSVPTGDVLFLNIDSGKTVRISRPAADWKLITASALTQSAVYRRNAEQGDRLTMVSAGEAPRELMHFNRQLAGVAGSKAVMFTRREPGDTEDRHDWLLLPPGRKPGDRHPLLVYFYPDQKYSKDWRSEDLREVSFLNQHIPAAQGFAVLFASMKISSMEKHGNPMTEMHEQLIHAAENIVQQGYVDATRWAIMGHSYGGYGTNCVITQTDRFKAAVALASFSNLSSSYAIGLSDARAKAAPPNTPFGVMWSEGGQGRMGVAPWQDPQRYLDNSPLFHADKIMTPLMLIHGDYDFVNVNEAEQLFNALHRQGKDVQLVRYWGEGHEVRSPANIRDMWQRIVTWLDIKLDIARDASGEISFANHAVRPRSQDNRLN